MAPVTSEEARMTPGQQQVLPDRYGQFHPVETTELIETKQKEFIVELDKIPDKSKQQLLVAITKCPELLTDLLKLMFLRCEVFNAPLAAKRFVAYWEKRVEIFGEERAFQPLTLASMDADDLIAGKLGIGNVISRTNDENDRSIWYFNTSKLDKTKYTKMNLIRIAWYMFHVALETSVTTQQKGMVFVTYARHTKLSEWDAKLEEMFITSVQGCLPVRVSGIHICHPPGIIFNIIWPIVRLFLSKQLRKRVKVHGGTNEKVNRILQEDYNININDIPIEMGGKRIIDPIAWFNERERIENTERK